MSSFMEYVKEEWKADKQINNVRRDDNKADVEHYYFSSFSDIIGNGVGMICLDILVGFFAFYIPEIANGNHVFYDGGMLTTIVGICLFALGFCVRHKLTWINWEDIRCYRVHNDTTEILYSVNPKCATILPMGTELKLDKNKINTSGIAEIQFQGRKGFINVNELTDITVYSKK